MDTDDPWQNGTAQRLPHRKDVPEWLSVRHSQAPRLQRDFLAVLQCSPQFHSDHPQTAVGTAAYQNRGAYRFIPPQVTNIWEFIFFCGLIWGKNAI